MTLSLLQHSTTDAQMYTPKKKGSTIKSHTFLFYSMLVGNHVTPMRMRIELLSSNILESDHTISHYPSFIPRTHLFRLSTFSNGLVYLVIYIYIYIYRETDVHGFSQLSQRPSSLPLLPDVAKK